MDNRLRLLYLLKYLLENTDEDHQLSTNQIIDGLKNEYGVSVHRETLSKDMDALSEYGVSILKNNTGSCHYCVLDRTFSLAELKLLIDAVESSKFITTKKSKELIAKLSTLVSRHQIKDLNRDNYLMQVRKPKNEKIYYIVDTINRAIKEDKQISFQYYDYTAKKAKVKRNKGEIYVNSPYRFIWSGDYYYIVGFSEKHKKVISFRVDRIAEIPEILDVKRIPAPDDFDISDYAGEIFHMFSGEETEVELRCDNSLMKTIIDRFGEGIKVSVYDESSFATKVTVSVSPTFFGWVFGFDGKIEILSPAEVREQYKERINKAAERLQ